MTSGDENPPDHHGKSRGSGKNHYPGYLLSVVLTALSFSLGMRLYQHLTSGSRLMANGHDNPLDHPEVRIGSEKDYYLGYLLSVVLAALSFSVVYVHAFPPHVLMAVITLIAVLLIGVQLYFFLGVDTSRAQRWKFAATLLAVPIFALIIALTIWVFYTLHIRTGFMGH